MSDLVRISHKGKPCDPPSVNGVEFVHLEDDLWIGEGTPEWAAGLTRNPVYAYFSGAAVVPTPLTPSVVPDAGSVDQVGTGIPEEDSPSRWVDTHSPEVVPEVDLVAAAEVSAKIAAEKAAALDAAEAEVQDAISAVTAASEALKAAKKSDDKQAAAATLDAAEVAAEVALRKLEALKAEG